MFSRGCVIFAAILMCYTSFVFYPRWNKHSTEATISWDVSGYYWYLPSVFIYHDLKHQFFKDSILSKYQPTNLEFQQGMKCDSNAYVMKYSSGMAFLYLPFFAVAHLAAKLLHYPPDGFSPPYQLAIQIGGLLCSLIGIWVLRKILLLYYTDKTTGIVLLLLVTASNYLNYSAIDSGMSHTWLFTLYVFLLWHTVQFYKRFFWRDALAIGLLVGFCTLCRPADIVSCLLPVCWGLSGLNKTAFTQWLSIFHRQFPKLLLAMVSCIAVVSIQLFYWKYATGHWLYYSYGDQHFSFLHPHPFLYTFDYKAGWLRYTPLFLSSFAGAVIYARNGKSKLAVLLFIAVNYYVVSSWDIYWYGGRAMIQSYPVLLLPMATLIETAGRKKLNKLLLSICIALFIYQNAWITWMYHKGNLYDPDKMTQQYYRRVAGRWSAPDSVRVLWGNCSLVETTPINLTEVYKNDFENDSTGLTTAIAPISGKRSAVLNSGNVRSPEYKCDIKPGTNRWLRVRATFRNTAPTWSDARIVVASTGSGTEKPEFFGTAGLVGAGATRTIIADFRLPDIANSVTLQLYNKDSTKTVLADDITAWTFNR